jgi:protocatechuate 3,4-dioxygenase beta subunit
MSRRSRISRRDTLKLVLAPAGAAIGGSFLFGCSDQADPHEHAPPPATNSGSGGADSTDTPATPSGGTGGTAPQATAGTSAGASGGADAPGSAAGAGASGNAAPASGAGGDSGAGGMSAPATSGAGGMAGSAGAVAGPSVPWASGGTQSMSGAYPDPFQMGMGGTPCALYPSQTLGPCYAQMPALREDISDGMAGLPLRLSFLVVRGNACMPVADASVDIWHSGLQGIYSAFSIGSICNPSTMNVRQEMFCRGYGMTDAAGRVDFSTIFPGWYSGRAVHIHFTVRIGASAEVTSQLYFDDDLVTEIQAQGEYAARGMRSTINSADATFRSGGASPEEVLMSTVKRPDGALHAWKVLAIS